ncbi:acyl-CoA dehydrogenase family protein [Natronorubrum sp. FCH18a]|uniref:acyl-CoA dehydrogenase family protein n=1 Tax=Natronorubrum sp. FCH18a TaxID=3447018 RepID=UPI003F50DFB1
MSRTYDDSDQAVELANRTREFIRQEVIPVEQELLLGGNEVSQEVIDDLRDKARDTGVYAPQVSEEYGGLGLSFRDAMTAYEQAGQSLLGPPSIRVDGPDEGNMHTLEMAGTETQKDRWLRPLVDGKIRSAFSMTEPMQGGGSDPKMIQTTAEKDGDEWIINGHKWWTSQGTESDVLFVMARTDLEAHPYEGCSFFIVPTETPGVEIQRDVPHMSGNGWGVSHAEIIYDNVRIPESNLLGERDEGFSLAQQRLGPARLTHCMRFSGTAERALETAKAYVAERRSFGEPLADKQVIRHELADAETKLHAVRTMVRNAASRIADGEEARTEVSMCKVFAANTVNEIVDTAMQYCGANAIGRDLPLSYLYENARVFRFVDGADEVHRRTIAKDIMDDYDPAMIDTVTRFQQ